jgi:hypothetical protein
MKLLSKRLFFCLFLFSCWASSEIPKSFEELTKKAFRRAHIETPAQNWFELEREFSAVLTRDPMLETEAPLFAEELAKLYLHNQHLQQALWTLERGGLYSHAQSLATLYETFLETEPILNIRAIGNGITKAQFVEFRNGTRGVLKPRDPGFPKSVEAEIWTYQLDRYMGFNIVPVTVKREINGKLYSLHAFVSDSKNSNIHFMDSPDSQYPVIQILDVLIGHADRHGGNSMFTAGGYLFAIDNGRIWDRNRTAVLSQDHPIPLQLQRSLQEADLQDIKSLFEPFSDVINSEILKTLMDQIRGLLNQDQLYKIPARPFHAKERRLHHRPRATLNTPLRLSIRKKIADLLRLSERSLKPQSQSQWTAPAEILVPFQLEPDRVLEQAFQNRDWNLLDQLAPIGSQNPDIQSSFFYTFARKADGHLTSKEDVRSLSEVLLKNSLLESFVQNGDYFIYKIAGLNRDIESRLVSEMDNLPSHRKDQALRSYVEYTFNLKASQSAESESELKSLILFLLSRTSKVGAYISLMNPDLLKSREAVREIEQVLVAEPQNTELLKNLVLADYFYRPPISLASVLAQERLDLFEKYLARQEERLPYDLILAKIHDSKNRDQLIRVYEKVLFTSENYRMAAEYIKFYYINRMKSRGHAVLEKIRDQFSSPFSAKQTFSEVESLLKHHLSDSEFELLKAHLQYNQLSKARSCSLVLRSN